MTSFQEFTYNKSFSQLAKESSFTFNLYRGRVDWKRLDALDIDRIVRDQDVEMLNIHLSSVVSCNLESEYDVKILDPNFIKLFRLAQLLIDFLMHCKSYLEHCIKIAHNSLQDSKKEVEALQKQLHARKSEVKQLKKKVKEIKLQLLHTPRFTNQNYECSFCGKVFMEERYLLGHHTRRHYIQPNSVIVKEPHVSNKTLTEGNNELKINKIEDITNIKKRYQEDIEEMKTMFLTEIEKLKQNEVFRKQISEINDKEVSTIKEYRDEQQPKKAEPSIQKPKQNEVFTKQTSEIIDKTRIPEVPVSKELTDEQEPKKAEISAKNGEEEWQRRLEEREGVWRARVSALDLQHKKQIQQLQERLNSSHIEGEEIKKDLERRLEEVLSKFEDSQNVLKNKQYSPKETHQEQPASVIETSTIKPQQEACISQPPPFEKRKAFVSQKTKTIQDEDLIEECKEVKETTDTMAKSLQLDDDSDFENICLPAEHSSQGIPDYVHSLGNKKVHTFLDTKDNVLVETSKRKNEENITKTPSRESMLQNIEKKSHDIGAELVEEEESSITETFMDTESESESLEENQSLVEEQVEVKKQTVSLPDHNLLRTQTQLAQQSLQRMEGILAANPNILQQLREDLKQLVDRRLKELGVDPDWHTIPHATFQQKMDVLTHQRKITAKNHKVYYTLRDKLSQEADAAVHSRPTHSTANSLLSRLRRKAAQVLNASKFTRFIGDVKKKEAVSESQSMQLSGQPLASSSPHLSLPTKTFSLPGIQATHDDSTSLSSSTGIESEESGKIAAVNLAVSKTSPEVASYKSALRNAVSTGNLTKKKVLFVDEAIKDEKRSLSENTVATETSRLSNISGNVSISSLVQEIQEQLSQRSMKIPHGVDLMKGPSSTELPLSQILPLTKTGREVLESQSLLGSTKPLTNLPSKEIPPDKQFPKTLEHLQNVPVRKPVILTPVTKKSGTAQPSLELKISAAKRLLQPPKLSPTHSLSSIGSSLFDIAGSPCTTEGNLEWDLQDLENNLKD